MLISSDLLALNSLMYHLIYVNYGFIILKIASLHPHCTSFPILFESLHTSTGGGRKKGKAPILLQFRQINDFD